MGVTPEASGFRTLMPKSQPVPSAQAKEVILQLGDLLSRIPGEYLLPGPHDPKQQVRFPAQELAESMAKGKTTMSLDRLARACPEVIRADPNRSVDVPFPFQKAMGQILHRDIADFSMRELRHRPSTVPVAAGPTIPAPANGNDDEKIHLSLHAIVAALPKDWRTPAMDAVDESARVALPLRLVEHQLPSGRVEVPMASFLEGMPANLRNLFPPDSTRPVPIPLTEVFPNLPERPTGNPSVSGLREQIASLGSSVANRDAKQVR